MTRWAYLFKGAVALLFTAVLGSAQAIETVTYFHNDVSGSPILATDASGAVLWKENYRPYGDKLNRQPASTGNKIGFHGKPYDNNTGLSYMGARYYDPLLGRFTGVDPHGFNPNNLHSFNRYAYANNNPYKYVDPDGRTPVDAVFFVFDAGRLGVALYTGVGVGDAALNLAASAVGVLSPVPMTGQAIKALSTAAKVASVVAATQKADGEDASKGEGSKEGSYTNTHESGKKYHGKGPEERAKQSGKEKAAEFDDPVKETEWKPAKNRREAFKDEAKRIENDGGVQNENNYNKRNSPGKKYLEQDAKAATPN